MRVRDYRPEDLLQIQAMHAAQGLGYELPDLCNGDFEVKKVLVDENDIPRRVLMARKTIELYLIGDDQWGTPYLRKLGIERLWDSVRRTLAILGFRDCNFWVPPHLDKSFGRRLKKSFGFGDNPWPCYSRRTGD